jgi:hypothetical protein
MLTLFEPRVSKPTLLVLGSRSAADCSRLGLLPRALTAGKDCPLCGQVSSANESDQVNEGHSVDALAIRGYEGRGTLR